MNIVNKVTLRNLKRNKRRTIVTIIGVIISVSMITAVATIGVSFLDLMKRITNEQSGYWHVQYKEMPISKVEHLQQDNETKTVILSKDYGYAMLSGGQNQYKPYLFVKAYNEQGFKYFPITLIEGRLPASPDEIVLSEHIASNGKVEYEIGDTLTLDVGRRTSTLEGEEIYTFTQSTPFQEEDGIAKEKLVDTVSKSYTVVGFIKRPYWEPTWSPGYTVLTYLDSSQLQAEDSVTASVILNKINRSLYDHADELADELQSEEVYFNNELLRYHGITNNDNLQKTMIALCAIIILIIMVGSVALIYNAFAISVSERSRHLGMLSSVGATKKQKRNSVFFEGAVIGLISIPLGILTGLIGIGLTFLYINSFLQDVFTGSEQKLELVISPMSIVVSCVVSSLTIFISSYIPALRASRMTAIDAIRQSQDVKLTKRKVKTSKIIRRVFSIEPELGLKNMKRNKRRYQATVFSLVISIVLFMSVSYFTDNMKRAMSVTQSKQNFDIMIWLDKDEEKNDWMYHEITSFEDVTEVSKMKEVILSAWIEQDELPQVEEAERYFHDQDGMYVLEVQIHALDEDSLRTYADKIGIDVERLLDPATPGAVLINTVDYYDSKRERYVETSPIRKQVGETLDLTHTQEETVELGSVEILKLTHQIPMGYNWESIGGVDLIVSESVLKQWSELDENIYVRSFIFLNSDDPMATQDKIEKLDESIDFYNLYQNRREEQQWILLLSVFTYGFIALISAITIANIFNTISTSVALRRREFAMLRSVGMTPKGFNRMINYESIFYGIKSLLYGLPLSFLVIWWIHDSTESSFNIGFVMPWWSFATVIVSVFLIVGASMLYAGSKVKKENIIDVLRQENL